MRRTVSIPSSRQIQRIVRKEVQDTLLTIEEQMAEDVQFWTALRAVVREVIRDELSAVGIVPAVSVPTVPTE